MANTTTKTITINEKDERALTHIERYYHNEIDLPSLHSNLRNIYGDSKTAVERFSELEEFYKANPDLKKINDFINEKSVKQPDGTLRISSDDWRELNRSLNRGKPGMDAIFKRIEEIANEEKNMKLEWEPNGGISYEASITLKNKQTVVFEAFNKNEQSGEQAEFTVRILQDGSHVPLWSERFLSDGNIQDVMKLANNLGATIDRDMDAGQVKNTVNNFKTQREEALRELAKDSKYINDPAVQAFLKGNENKISDKDFDKAMDEAMDDGRFENFTSYDNDDDLETKTWREETNRRIQNNLAKTAPGAAQNNIKEKIMSDTNEAYEKYMDELGFSAGSPDSAETPERNLMEESFKNAVHQRIVVSNAVKNDTLACLPDSEGFADTLPAVNLVNGTFYHGDTLLVLKEHQRENAFPTAEYVTHAQIEKAKQDKPGLMIREGEKGVSIYFQSKNKETGEYEIKSARLFNVAQTTKPWEMKDWAVQKQQEEEQRRVEYLKTQYGSNYKPHEPKPKEPGPEIACSSTEPAKYLGEYLAAVSLGGKFKVSPEQAAEFKQKIGDSLWEKIGTSPKTGQPVTDPFKLSKISSDANKHCVEVIKEIKMKAQKIDNPEQKREQTQSQGRKM